MTKQPHGKPAQDFEHLAALLGSGDLKLSQRLRQVAAFVLNNPEDVAIRNITELAKMAEVPVSTITRFCKELNYSGFAELQDVFRDRLLGPRRPHIDELRGLPQPGATAPGRPDLDDPSAVFDTFVQSGVNTLLDLQNDLDRSQLAQFVTLCAEAETIYIIAGRGAYGVGEYCVFGFAQIGKQAILVDNSGSMRHEQLRFATPADVVLAISFDSYTPETIEMAQAAAARGLRVLSVTDNELSPLSRIGSATLYVREARLGHFRSQIPAMALCQSVMVSVGRQLPRQDSTEPPG